MGSLIPSELSLDCKFSSKTWVPKTIGDFLAEVSRVGSPSEKASKLDDYVNRLQDEMKKIDAFKRELPLCMLLLSDAIVTMKDELVLCKKSQMEPVLEEFIPLKNGSCTDEKDEKLEGSNKGNDAINTKDKMSWMSSVQLWTPENQQHHNPNVDFSNKKPTLKLDNNIKKRTEDELNPSVMDSLFQSGKSRTVGRAFVPFKGCTNLPWKEDKDELPGVPGLTLRMPEIKNSMEEINNSSGFSSKSSSSRSGSSSATNGHHSNFKSGQQQTARKQRRCWSPELHRRFVNALQQLGGAQAATPKQIRDLMQVDGLTNDEVKSHLQKYRLHTRKSNTVQPVGLGGLWMSQEQCTESSKQSNSQSGSPQGPLHLTTGTSMTGGDSMEEEDDEKSESHSWKSHHHHIHLSRRDDV